MRKIVVLIILSLLFTGCIYDFISGVINDDEIIEEIIEENPNDQDESADIANISELKQIADMQNQDMVSVSGYSSANDGGGSDFIYLADSKVSADNYMIITPASGAGRWHRVWYSNEPLNVKWFGVQSGVEQCQAPQIQVAINYLKSKSNSGTIYFPAGEYFISGSRSIPIEVGINIKGAGNDQTNLWSNNGGRYLLNRSRGNLNLTISDLSIQNPDRLILMQNISNITFEKVRFLDGMVRFENSEQIVINNSRFENNSGKGAYASDECRKVTLTNNLVINPKEGGFNLSRHSDSYVVNNIITSDVNINSGYAGIRLPNNAKNNIVENNTIVRTGRGIFVLSGSEDNIIRNNEVRETTSQGIFVESSTNIIESNTIIDAGGESIYVNNSGSSNAHNNIVRGNIISDTKRHSGNRFIALRIYGTDNQVINNQVSTTHGRKFKDISSGNTDLGNSELR